MAASAIVGRVEELGSIESFLPHLEAGPAPHVRAGDAGRGKTTLWEAAVDEAGHRFGSVLSCRGIAAEAGLSFAGLSDLLSEALSEVGEELLPLRRHALEVALLLAEPGEDSPDPRVIGIAFLDVLRLLAERRPVVVAVDDLQWLDVPSAGAVQLALRRLRTERVGFLATVLEAPNVSVPIELERALAQSDHTQLALGPLEPGALHQLLRSRLELELPRPELARVDEATAGNPFFALELGRELARGVEGRGAARPLRLPGSLSTLLGRRLERLPQQAREILLVVAASGRPTPDVVAAAHGNREEALEALELASREGVLVLDGARVRFAHPLLASVCYEDAPPWRRQEVHRALASVVPDLEERARHLALGTDEPDADVANALDDAAAHAAARGATAAAAELAELAAEMTSPENPADRRRRRLAAGWFHRLAGDFERATATFEQLLDEVPGGVERCDVLYALATIGSARSVPVRIELCREALEAAGEDDVRRARLLGFLGVNRWLGGDVRGGLADARAGLEHAERVGEPALLATALGRVGFLETWALEITPGLLERGVALEEGVGRPLIFHDSPRYLFASRTAVRDDPDLARELLEAVERDAEARGDEHTRSFAALSLLRLEWLAGRWERALELAGVTAELAEQTHELLYAGTVAAARARLETDLGLLDEARASVEHGLECATRIGDEINVVGCLAALGCVELARGNVHEAAGYLRELPARILATGHRMPGPLDFWSDAIEALIGVGELDTARVYVLQYEELAELASRRAVACAARCRGLLAAAEGDLPAACDALERALAVLETAAYPLERARTLLGLGSARRQARQKRPAREALEQALAIFDELGAPLWADKARLELGRISGRRPASDELSETEWRVAALAAEGRANKEIAAELYVSVRTVEAHLSRIYAKLGVRSRAALARRLALATDDAKAAGEAANVQ
jgi:DNA-binding CsgD family transcriptional regulator